MKDGHTIEHCWMKKKDERENDGSAKEKSEQKPKEKKEKSSRVAFASASDNEQVENDFDMLCMKLSYVTDDNGLPDAFLVEQELPPHVRLDVPRVLVGKVVQQLQALIKRHNRRLALPLAGNLWARESSTGRRGLSGLLADKLRRISEAYFWLNLQTTPARSMAEKYILS
eukprot:CAMPEP_0181323626 /NCGR_PEP_ID=MMETSP1101-20121128/19896_1 /TAXON_ID=46948 /ORGANISM="Rhodomonas abbreviata, Strain Caron Lab Isolate" /LENGTH=169 /DNA_ID=CAMNT_0023431687 /DNA_START=137 /DNA_END=644 /DNA_ORIENTATION=-